jgi:hypothetical protein
MPLRRAVQGRDLVRAGQVAQVQRHGPRLGGERHEAVHRAPFRKMGPVDAVGLQGIGRFCPRSEVAGILGDQLETCQRPLLAIVFTHAVDRSVEVVVSDGLEQLQRGLGLIGGHDDQGTSQHTL